MTKCEVPPDEARNDVIMSWMEMGDLRPLAAAITDGHVSDEVLKHLAGLIGRGAQLTMKRRRGKPKQATKASIKLITALMYEFGIFDSKRSDDAFREIAKNFGVSEQTVRQAVTRFRKPTKPLCIETL